MAKPFDGDVKQLGRDATLTGRWYAEQFLASWNSRDIPWILSLIADDAVIDDSSFPSRLRGKAEWAKAAEVITTALPDLRYDLLDGPFLHPSGNSAIFVYRMRGTLTGPLGRKPPTGRSLDISSMEMLEFRDGLVNRDFHRMDMADFSRQLGLGR